LYHIRDKHLRLLPPGQDFRFARRPLEAALAAQEKDYYAAQCRLMQETVEQTSSARHDMKTHMVAINGYAAKINAREISAYLAPLLGAIGEIRLYSSTGNIARVVAKYNGHMNITHEGGGFSVAILLYVRG